MSSIQSMGSMGPVLNSYYQLRSGQTPSRQTMQTMADSTSSIQASIVGKTLSSAGSLESLGTSLNTINALSQAGFFQAFSLDSMIERFNGDGSGFENGRNAISPSSPDSWTGDASEQNPLGNATLFQYGSLPDTTRSAEGEYSSSIDLTV